LFFLLTGDALLILCASDVDKSGKSYYGEQSLYCLNINGKSFGVKTNKEGPIHCAEWSPTHKESFFCVIYGFVPAKTAFFNSEAEMMFDFGEMNVNLIHFNSFGNLLLLSGFGNLRGGLYIWNVEKRKLVAEFKSPDTTHISWAPDGVHLITAVTSPRMRVSNGFKIWHYSGKLLHEYSYPDNSFLYKLIWRPYTMGTFVEPEIPDSLISSNNIIKKEPEPARYIPPHLRKGNKAVPEKPPGKSKYLKLIKKERKIKALEKRLERIDNLKKLEKSGKVLEANQKEKINKEEELRQELETLKLS